MRLPQHWLEDEQVKPDLMQQLPPTHSVKEPAQHSYEYEQLPPTSLHAVFSPHMPPTTHIDVEQHCDDAVHVYPGWVQQPFAAVQYVEVPQHSGLPGQPSPPSLQQYPSSHTRLPQQSAEEEHTPLDARHASAAEWVSSRMHSHGSVHCRPHLALLPPARRHPGAALRADADVARGAILPATCFSRFED